MEVVLNRDAFLKGLQMVQNIVEPRQTLPILANVLLETEGDTVRLTATDLEVGARVSVPARVVGKGAITVSARKLTEIMRVLGSGEDVEIALTENQFVLQMPNFVLTARLIEGQFPNYEAVIPKSHPGRLLLPRGALIAALRRVSVVAEERNKPVKFVLAPASLKLSASSQESGEAEESLDVDYAGAELTIGFNSRYVLDALAPIEKDQIVFEFKDALSPGVIKSVEEEGYCCVIMPM